MRLLHKYPKIVHIVTWIIIVCVGAYILYLRYPYHFNISNFYGEDGNVYVENIYDKGPLFALFSLFNGYLIVLQYLAVLVGFVINYLVGDGFITLAKSLSIVSYFTIAMVCSIPWLLFRKKLGILLSLALVLLLLFVPLAGSDFAVIGTIGNLKFLFFFMATALIIYRNDKELCPENSTKLYLVDLTLLLCVATNITVVALLPAALYRYAGLIKTCFKNKRIKPFFQNKGFISLLILMVMSFTYICVIYLHGVPTIPGYLDTPLRPWGLMNAFYRSSWYGLLYPLHTTLNHFVVAILLLLLLLSPLFFKKKRPVVFIMLWAIFITVMGFVVNRPGVTEFLTGYSADGGPGQFFYGGTMIFIFAVVYLGSDWFHHLRASSKVVVILTALLYVSWAFPFAGFRAKSYQFYAGRPSLYVATRQACSATSKDVKTITVPIYPLDGWNMQIERVIACQIK